MLRLVAGKDSLASAFTVMFIGGALIWVSTHVIGMMFEGTPWMIFALLLRTVLIGACVVALWRCAANATLPAMVLGRLAAVACGLAYLGIFLATLFPLID